MPPVPPELPRDLSVSARGSWTRIAAPSFRVPGAIQVIHAKTNREAEILQ
jgi:hypothetical protein